MKIVRLCVRGSVLLGVLCAIQTWAQSTNSLTGLWDFNQNDLRATVGAPLQFRGSTDASTTFDTTVINGATAHVLHFPAATPAQGYVMPHGAKPNGGGTNVNQYTLVMDLMWPSDSSGAFRALFNTDTNNVEDAIMFVNPDNAIGVNNDYVGEMLPDTWYRLALVFDLNPTNSTITKYLNTTNVGVQLVGEGMVDSRFSAGPALLLFADNDNETRSGLVDRIQFFSDPLTEEQIVSLGTPIGDSGPPVTTDVKIESIRKEGNNVVITVSGGGNLQLQTKAKLTDASWTNAGAPSASGTFTVPIGSPLSFFRAQRL